MTTCYICRHPGQYDSDSCKMLLEYDLCENHRVYCQERAKQIFVLKPFKATEIQEKGKETVVAGKNSYGQKSDQKKSFLPPIKTAEKSFYEKERPDNDGELIE